MSAARCFRWGCGSRWLFEREGALLNGLDLFAGIGGIALGLKRAGLTRTVCYVENEPYCVEVLKRHMCDGQLDDAPVWDDVRTFDGRPWRGYVDIITGGFPCQDLSVAGKRAGIEGSRSGLWFEMLRIIREVRPAIVLVENVPGLLIRGADRVFGDLAESGYCAEWDCIPASAVGANHQRDRVFIVAYTASDGVVVEVANGTEGGRQDVADADTARLAFRQKQKNRQRNLWYTGQAITKSSWWTTEPDVGRLVTRISPWLESDINAHEKCYQKAKSKGIPITQGVRTLWGNKETPEAPSQHQRCLLCGHLMSEMPHESRDGPWHLGQGVKEGKGLCCVRQEVCKLHSHASQNLREEMPECYRAAQCEQTMENRTDRLKALGNAVVPQVAEYIGRRINAWLGREGP